MDNKFYELKKKVGDEILYGRHYEVIDQMSKMDRMLYETAPEADYNENNPSWLERQREFEQKFDEWHAKRREENPISQQCLNFLQAIRTRYQRVGMVKLVTDKLNSRERQLVWATWKGFAHYVYYPKG
jgi:broad specificity phosphatase PhoE